MKSKKYFNNPFFAWDIVLPEESLLEIRLGSIVGSGGKINYQFGDSDGIFYVELFASHRMTNDTLNRIYADGREELVGYCQEFYLANNEEAKQEYFQHNREFYEDVKRGGHY